MTVEDVDMREAYDEQQVLTLLQFPVVYKGRRAVFEYKRAIVGGKPSVGLYVFWKEDEEEPEHLAKYFEESGEWRDLKNFVR